MACGVRGSFVVRSSLPESTHQDFPLTSRFDVPKSSRYAMGAIASIGRKVCGNAASGHRIVEETIGLLDTRQKCDFLLLAT